METKEKLLVLCQLFYPELISTGQTLTELCEKLAKLGVDIEVICGPLTIMDNARLPKHLSYKGMKINRVWGTRFPKLNVAGRVINQITYAFSVFISLLLDRSKRPILVLTNPPFLAVFCALLKMMRIGKPFVYLIFDVYPDTAIRLGLMSNNGLIAKLWDGVNTFTFKSADKIIVIGRCMKNVIETKMGTSLSKIKMVHIWSDDELIKESLDRDNPFIKKWGLKDKFIVSYSGNMGWFHDMETIMEAAKKLKEENEILFLLMVRGIKRPGWSNTQKNMRLKIANFIHMLISKILVTPFPVPTSG